MLARLALCAALLTTAAPALADTGLPEYRENIALCEAVRQESFESGDINGPAQRMIVALTKKGGAVRANQFMETCQLYLQQFRRDPDGPLVKQAVADFQLMYQIGLTK